MASIIFFLLIFLCLASLGGLLFFEEYIRKISCLSIAYSSFLILIILLALKNSLVNEVLMIATSILIVFAINLLIGIGIAKNIAESSDEKKN
jgi:hypothetical protein